MSDTELNTDSESLTVADINEINRRLELGAPSDPVERKRIADLMWKLTFLAIKIERAAGRNT